MTDPLTDEQLAELRELAEKADTPAPWETRTEGLGEPWRVCNDSETVQYLGFDIVADFTEHDAAFIAASREAMPRLLAEVERLRGERDAALHEMHARELHHFESEEALEAAEKAIVEARSYFGASETAYVVKVLDRYISDHLTATGQEAK